jgi:aconitate hydratase
MQDFSGIPVLNDLAAMRAAVVREGGDPLRVNPVVPVDLVVDHSLQVDHAGVPDAFEKNTKIEFKRNYERYAFLRWSEMSFDHLRVIPPASGIIHQVNLELLANVVVSKEIDGVRFAYPDSLVGTDSHTTMVNGLGVLGWGVGGIEAVGAMLGEPVEIPMPEVIGLHLTGRLPEGTTPTDLTLTITQLLRQHGVVDKFVEVFGQGVAHLSLADRAMLSNMAPESGATVIYFPVDEQTLHYLQLSGRTDEVISLVETYCKSQHLFRSQSDPTPVYTTTITLDLGTVVPSLAGPKRPQDRIPLNKVAQSFRSSLGAPVSEGGFGLSDGKIGSYIHPTDSGSQSLTHGAVIIAAITSCTNTSNPFVMLSAGLLARNAVSRGLKSKPWVKTSLAPGSKVVMDYLHASGLDKPLAYLGFELVGYGCTTCIGNSGPINEDIVAEIQEKDLIVATVLSGNRNFEGRISPYARANYLASPPLVVAYALTGTIDIDLAGDALGYDEKGQPIYLSDIWPSSAEVQELERTLIKPILFRDGYRDITLGTPDWLGLPVQQGVNYTWDLASTYLREPPFFAPPSRKPGRVEILGARVLVWAGDSMTTDHISPAGSIPLNSPAGQYLVSQGVSVMDFNAYGTRRGHDEVMRRGTFANIRLKNRLLPGIEGGYTVHHPSGETMTIFEASLRYGEDNTPLVVLAGREYGTGSSRDWAAKGAALLGVRTVIAESYERIHRSNLAGMGILPLQFLPGQNADSLGLNGQEAYEITMEGSSILPGMRVQVRAHQSGGTVVKFETVLRLDTPTEIQYYMDEGMLRSLLVKHLEG